MKEQSGNKAVIGALMMALVSGSAFGDAPDPGETGAGQAADTSRASSEAVEGRDWGCGALAEVPACGYLVLPLGPWGVWWMPSKPDTGDWTGACNEEPVASVPSEPTRPSLAEIARRAQGVATGLSAGRTEEAQQARDALVSAIERPVTAKAGEMVEGEGEVGRMPASGQVYGYRGPSRWVERECHSLDIPAPGRAFGCQYYRER